jgi:hypothetical protein
MLIEFFRIGDAYLAGPTSSKYESLLFNSPGHSKSIALYPFAYFCFG